MTSRHCSQELVMFLNNDDGNWEKRFVISDEELNRIRDARWLYPNLIIEGHIVVIAAEPNGGKTTIFEFIASQIANNMGKRVIYVNADIASSDLLRARDNSLEGKYTLLTPDFIIGESMTSVVRELINLNKSAVDLSDKVYIFDTMKKMADVITKKESKGLMKVLRGLTAKGATIVLLAHTNKYKDADGNPIFEGTIDVKADADELIYFIPLKKHDGSMVVSTKPDKVRGIFESITFNISPDRKVAQENKFVDIEYEKLVAENKNIVNTIKQAIILGRDYQSAIVRFAESEGSYSRLKVLDILKSFDGVMWTTSRIGKNNKVVYTIKNSTPPDTSNK